MLSTILQTVRRHALFAAGDRVLVAVSGGPDSMALLAALWELGPRLKLALEVVSVDHGLREVAGELALVHDRAQALGLPWHRLAVDPRAAGTPRGLQEAARRERLAALAALAAERDCARVALGHQADDQAETVLFRILRGTGLRGLSGIPYFRGPFVRPLLDVTRAQILAYLRRRSLAFVTDPSNADLRFSRARLRHVVLPALRHENPRVGEALRRLAAEAARAPAAEEPMVRAAREAGVHVPARLGAALAAAARRGGTRTFDVAGGRRLTLRYGRLTATHQPIPAAPAPVASPSGLREERSIAGAGRFVVDAETVLIVRETAAPAPRSGGGEEWAWFDRERLVWPLSLRTRRPGDRMRPRGGGGSRKLSDLLIDAKVPRDCRDGRPVIVAADGEILYVPGLRPSQLATPTKHTRTLVAMATVPIATESNFTGP